MQELAKSISELVNSLNGGAKGLADAMQRVAPDAWRVAVRQVVIDAATGWAAWLLFAVLLLVVAAKFSANQRWNESAMATERGKEHPKQSALDNYEEHGFTWQGLKWAALLVAAVTVLVSSSSYIPDLLNPQYAAASQLSARFLGK